MLSLLFFSVWVDQCKVAVLFTSMCSWMCVALQELNVGYDTDTRFWKQSEVRDLVRYARLRGASPFASPLHSTFSTRAHLV